MQGLTSDKNPMWSVMFWNRVHRYRCLVTKYWWLLVLTLSATIFAAVLFLMYQPVRFGSVAQTRVDVGKRQVDHLHRCVGQLGVRTAGPGRFHGRGKDHHQGTDGHADGR